MISALRTATTTHIRTTLTRKHLSLPSSRAIVSSATANAAHSHSKYTLLLSCAAGTLTGLTVAHAEGNAWTKTASLDTESQTVLDEVYKFLGLNSGPTTSPRRVF